MSGTIVSDINVYGADLVWACAAAAQRINGEYLKNTKYSQYDDGEIYEKRANKNIVNGFLYKSDLGQLTNQVNAEDYATGKTAREYWQGQLLYLINDNANPYLKACAKIAHEDAIAHPVDIALISSCVNAYYNEIRKQTLLDLKYSLDSKHVCDIGSRVNFKCEINVIESRYIDKLETNIVTCIVEGNLYSWWSKSYIGVGKYAGLCGRVKDHTTDYHSGKPVTMLNYVKVIKK